MGVNDDIRDAALRHQLGLLRVDNSTLRKILRLLEDADLDLQEQIRGRIAKLAERGFDTGAVTTRRLEELQALVRRQSRQLAAALGRALRKELLDLADYEREFQSGMMKSTVPVNIGFRTVSPEVLEAIVTRRPFRGRLLSEWAERIGADRVGRVMQEIKLGLVEGESSDSIIRRIRGTKDNHYRDGILRITRRDAEGVVRTASAHVTNSARDVLYERNADVLQAVRWDSTMDGRVTPQCYVRHTKRYTVADKKPIDHQIPWLAGPGRLHFNCRSASIPEIKPYRELGLDIDDPPPGVKASMAGQIPADMSPFEFIEGPGKRFAGDVFGPTRLRLLREGKLTPQDLFGSRGQFWSLDELRRREAEAFVEAGLRAAA